MLFKNKAPALYAIALSGSAALCSSSASSQSFDWAAEAHVTIVEVSYMPGLVTFQIDTNAGACATGSWLSWNIQGSTQSAKDINAQSVLAALMTAQVSGRPVWLAGDNSGCKVRFLHLK